MRTKLVVLFLGVVFTGSAFGAIVMEKRSRQVPYVEVFGCQGVHSFVFRGPVGYDRRPVLVPPREYWTAQEAGIYSFVLRYSTGEVCSRLVTPEVFARYRVGDDFNVCAPVTEHQMPDNKSVQPATHQQHQTAQARAKAKKSSLQVAKHKRKKSSHRTAKNKKKHRAPRLAAR